MSESSQLYRHSVECLRFEADCRELAKNVQSPNLQSHFLRMALTWRALAVSGPSAGTVTGISESETHS